jgi:hypothetical protein
MLAACSVGLSAQAATSLSPDSDTSSSDDVTSFTDGILTYTVLDDSMNVEISSCVSTATNVNILPKIDGYTITGIGEGAFTDCESLQSVTFPENGSITEVGSYAFAQCTALTSVTLPDSLTEIPVGMFAYCTALENVTFGSEVTTIGDEAFRGTALQSVELPETLTTMGNFVFYMCTDLESITIPEGLETLGAYSFMGCVSMESFHIPSTLLSVGDASFLGCMNLTDLTVDDDHPYYKVEDGILYSQDGTILYFYPPARTDTTFTVPDGVQDIYDGAFFECTNLQYVELPEGLIIIGSGAFDYCSSLTAVTIPESVTQIMSSAYSDCTALESVTFAGAEDEDDGEGEDLVISDYAFYVCDSLTEVILPKRVTEIGEYAFGCTSIEDSSGNEIPTAVEGFMLRGFSAAEDYIKDCDLSVGFSPRNFPWKTVVFWVCAAAVLLVIVVLAIRIIKKNMMTPEEREALRQAKEAQKVPLSEREGAEDASETPDDGYQSILGEDDEEEIGSLDDNAVEQFRSVTPAMLHHAKHADAEDEEEAATDTEDAEA